jgi:hypothetical protein
MVRFCLQKATILFKIAKAVRRSIEWLLTGRDGEGR